MPIRPENRDRYPDGYALTDNVLHELLRVSKDLANQSDEALDAGDGIMAGQYAHESNCVAFAAAILQKRCEWHPDDDGVFHTGCGHAFYFDSGGGPAEHGQQFCGYCGGSLSVVQAREAVD